MINKQLNTSARLGTMLLDHFFMCMIAMVFYIPAMVAVFSRVFTRSHEQAAPDFMEGTPGYIGMFGFALYFCKDIFNGRSIAKRILKLQLVDNKTGEVASPLQCFVRNILCMLWPVEVIAALINPARRIGDKIAGTRLEVFDPAAAQPKIKFGKIILPVVISYGLCLLLAQALPKTITSKPIYSETSYNHTAGKGLEQLLTDSLEKYFIPDIRVYDTVKGTDVKYISAVLNLRKNYLRDKDLYNRLNEKVTNLICSKYPVHTFTGKLKYVYTGTGQFQSTTVTIGAYLEP